ncbi:MAG: hypothetical protein JRD89_18440 [Deltaproteobacteria bacterium]|nr:hypothetical protein [Deltaproteobacteria bacterium]
MVQPTPAIILRAINRNHSDVLDEIKEVKSLAIRNDTAIRGNSKPGLKDRMSKVERFTGGITKTLWIVGGLFLADLIARVLLSLYPLALALPS